MREKTILNSFMLKSYVNKNPNKSITDIAKQFRCTPSHVSKIANKYQIIWPGLKRISSSINIITPLKKYIIKYPKKTTKELIEHFQCSKELIKRALEHCVEEGPFWTNENIKKLQEVIQGSAELQLGQISKQFKRPVAEVECLVRKHQLNKTKNYASNDMEIDPTKLTITSSFQKVEEQRQLKKEAVIKQQKETKNPFKLYNPDSKKIEWNMNNIEKLRSYIQQNPNKTILYMANVFGTSYANMRTIIMKFNINYIKKHRTDGDKGLNEKIILNKANFDTKKTLIDVATKEAAPISFEDLTSNKDSFSSQVYNNPFKLYDSNNEAPHWNLDLIEKLNEYVKRHPDKKCENIANVFGVSTSVLRNIFEVFGISYIKKPTTKPNEINIDEVAKYIEEHPEKTLADIATAFRTSSSSLKKVFEASEINYIKKSKGSPTKVNIDDVKKYVESHPALTVSQLAKHFGTCYSRMLDIIQNNNLPCNRERSLFIQNFAVNTEQNSGGNRTSNLSRERRKFYLEQRKNMLMKKGYNYVFIQTIQKHIKDNPHKNLKQIVSYYVQDMDSILKLVKKGVLKYPG